MPGTLSWLHHPDVQCKGCHHYNCIKLALAAPEVPESWQNRLKQANGHVDLQNKLPIGAAIATM